MIAVVIVNECAGLGPGDWLYWMLSCWAPIYMRAVLPMLAGALVFGAAAPWRRPVPVTVSK